MTYGLINGTVINGADDDSGPANRAFNFAGLDAGRQGTALSDQAVDAVGEHALDAGDLGFVFGLSPEGIDAGKQGDHTGLFEKPLPFDGIDAGREGAQVVDVAATAAGEHAAEIGDARVRNGVDVAVLLQGMEAGREGLHMAMAEQPDPIPVVTVNSAKAAEFGAFKVSLTTITVDAAGASAAEVGVIGIVPVATAAGTKASEFGDLSFGGAVVASGGHAAEFGPLTFRTSHTLGGMEAGRQGRHAAGAAPIVVDALGVHAAEIGDVMAFGATAYARQFRAAEFGHLQVGRGATC